MVFSFIHLALTSLDALGSIAGKYHRKTTFYLITKNLVSYQKTAFFELITADTNEKKYIHKYTSIVVFDKKERYCSNFWKNFMSRKFLPIAFVSE